ncbi:molybdenum ABC transporter ATP-binding protein [Thalassotalea mangrovi]|uniref:Molybdenum ABC transporter ATP-binding protein n=1 Tax=Thalassotalea mangrovi TaxID=2572245 RepID=A0A4U1BB39_9GAMM|nr:molybdenum ABC transporter ATP-binding protein [Thalassotalea mangrovi]TKB47388.1 molybdenum ABC transporter ATP-binding protein [Thalassotalea mangrovi]
MSTLAVSEAPQAIQRDLSVDVNLSFDSFQLSCDIRFDLNGITGILGHSGSGKTSLLRVIAGLNRDAAGTVILKQRTLQSDTQFIKPEHRKIGFVFQDARLFPHLSVAGNLEYARKRCKPNSLDANEIIQMTQIGALLKRDVVKLSAGEKQRVAIARALLAEPELLLMDEPLSNLDNRARRDMVHLLRLIHQRLNLPILYVSHNIIEIQQLADEVLVMENGRIIQVGHVHQVLNNLNERMSTEFSSPTSLTLKVKQHLVNFGLTQLDFMAPSHNQVKLFAPLMNQPLGQQLRCYILADDLSISLNKPEASSIINCLPGRISQLHRLSRNGMLIKVQVMEHTFAINTSRYAVELLRLSHGTEVFIQFQADAIRCY